MLLTALPAPTGTAAGLSASGAWHTAQSLRNTLLKPSEGHTKPLEGVRAFKDFGMATPVVEETQPTENMYQQCF